MKVSVIIPVYNTPLEVFKVCVSSILAIDDCLREVIIVDDGSCDNLHAAYSDYIRQSKTNKVKLVHKENGGVSSARNVGLGMAQGEYVMFVDSDDVLVGEAFADPYGDADMIIFDSIMLKGKRNKRIYRRGASGSIGIKSPEELLKNIILDGKLGFIHGIVYKREFLKSHNIRFNQNRIQQEDADFNFAVVNAKPLAIYVGKTAYCYNYSAKTAIGRWVKAPDKMIAGGAERYEQRMEYVKSVFPEDSAKMQKLLTAKRIRSLYQNGVDLFCAGQATTENKDKIQQLMIQITLPEDVDNKTRRCYQAIVRGQWETVSLRARLRVIYLWIMGI